LETDAPAGSYASAAMMSETDGALWAAAFIGGAYLQGNYLYNLGAGTANNILQRERVEVLAVAGKVVTVRGRDPRRLTYGISRVNPEWPLPDPVTGSTARLQFDEGQLSLPTGSIFEPAWPSCLYRKLNPMVTRVIPPTGAFISGDQVEYQIEVWSDMSSLRAPYDRKRPPADGRYWASIGFMGVQPEKWANWQAYPQAWWTAREIELTVADLAAASGVVALKDSAGNDCRVLPRWAGANVLRVVYTLTGGVRGVLPASETDAALVTTDNGSGWSSTLNLAALLGFPDLVSVRIFYMPEARIEDGAAWVTKGACANSQRDATGSFVHGTARRCTNVGCSKFSAGTFRDECWDPKATGFTLGCGQGPGAAVFPAADARDNGNGPEIAWSAQGTVIRQGLPGVSSHRNFWFERKTRTSLQQLVGSFSDAVPRSPGAGWVELLGRVWGQREIYTENGETRQRLRHGLFEAEGAGMQGAAGLLIPGWQDRTNQRRSGIRDAEAAFPSFGPAPASVADGSLGGGAMAHRLRVSEAAHQIYVVGINPQRVNAAVRDYAERLN
jgi:hypothetical protein